MSATVNLQISLDTLIQAMSALDLQAKRQLLEVIEQQIFEAEEAEYQEDAPTQAEIKAVQLEYSQGEFTTIDDRIRYEIDDANSVLRVLQCKHRREVYKDRS